MSYKIFQYWEDQFLPDGTVKPKPAYYRLCQETVALHNPETVVVTPESLPDYLGMNPPECLQRLYISHRVDWIRKMLLVKQGGLYVDSDFVCFQNLQSLAGLAETFDFVGYKEWNGGIMDNFMIARRGSSLLQRAADIALGKAQGDQQVSWLAMASEAMEAAFAELKWQIRWIMLPTHLVEPINVMSTSWFFATEHAGPENDPSCLGYLTSYHSMRTQLSEMSEEQLLRGPTRLSSILRRGFEQPQRNSSSPID